MMDFNPRRAHDRMQPPFSRQEYIVNSEPSFVRGFQGFNSIPKIANAETNQPCPVKIFIELQEKTDILQPCQADSFVSAPR